MSDRPINDKFKDNIVGRYTSGEQHVAWSGVNFQYKPTEDKPIEPEKNTSIKDRYAPLAESLMKHEGTDKINVWRQLKAMNWGNSNMPLNPQQIIESMMGIKPGEEFVAWDLETLGTLNGDKSKGQMDFYMVQEIAMKRYRAEKSKSGALELVETGNAAGKDYISLLAKPNKDEKAYLQGLIDKVKTNKSGWAGLTDDERRTLNDLILYSDSDPMKNEYFKRHGDLMFVEKQVREHQSMSVGKKISRFTGDHLTRAQRGLDNMVKYGTTPDHIRDGLADFLNRDGKHRMIGFNTVNFDLPVIKDFIDNKLGGGKGHKAIDTLNKNLLNVKHVDVFSGMRTAYASLLKNSPDLKQSTIANAFEVTLGKMAHLGIADLQATVGIFNKLVNEKGLLNVVNNFDKYQGHGIASGNTNAYKARSLDAKGNVVPGDKIFSVGGIANNQISPADMVFRLDGKGNYVPAYDMQTTPIYKHTKYEIDKFVDGVEFEGKNYTGVMLKNLNDDGLFHFVSSENTDSLKTIMQKNFVAEADMHPAQVKSAEKAAMKDRARRRWAKMFGSDNDGLSLMEKMLMGLDGVKEGKSQPEIAKMVSDAGLGKWTSEMHRDLGFMRGRLEGERGFLEQFVQSVKNNGNISGKKQESAALRRLRSLMDEEFGANVGFQKIGANRKYIPDVMVDGKEGIIDVTDIHSARTSITGLVFNGMNGKVAPSVSKARLTQIANHLMATGGFGDAPGQTTTTGAGLKELKEIKEMIKNVGTTPNSVQYRRVVERLASFISHQDRKLKLGAVDGIDIENPSKLLSERRKEMKAKINTRGKTIIQKAQENAGHLGVSPRDGNKNIVFGDKKLNALIDAHDSQFNKMLSSLGFDEHVDKKSLKDSLSKLANAYSKGDTKAAFMINELGDDRHRTLTMVLMNKNDVNEIFGLAENEIIGHQKVAAIPIPIHDGKGNIVMPGSQGMGIQKKLARLVSSANAKEGTRISTGTDIAIQRLIGMASSAKDMMGQGKIGDVEGWLGSQVKDSINNLSLRNVNKNMSDYDDWFQGKESKARMWMLSGMYDTTGHAEEWYKNFYAGRKDKNINNVYQAMDQKIGSTFYESMGMKEQEDFQRDIDGYLKGAYNVVTSAHSAKDTYVSEGIRSINDVRQLTPFGFHNPMARENIMKSVNYKALDTEEIRGKLRKQGKTESEIKRILNRGFVTTSAKEILENSEVDGKASYLNVRSAHMHLQQLTGRLQDTKVQEEMRKAGMSQDEIARLSTYDGKFLVSESMAELFDTRREMRIKLEDGAELDSKIANLFKEGAYEIDADGTMRLKKEANLLKVMGGRNSKRGYEGTAAGNKITVGWLNRNGKMQDAAFYSDPNNNTKIKGFNTQTGELILDKIEKARNGTKMITDTGERVTMTVVKDNVMNAIAPGVQAIFEEVKTSRRTFGMEFYKNMGLVVDELRKNTDSSGKVTVGKLHGAEVEGVMKDLLKKSFGKEDLLKYQDGQFVINGLMNIDPEKKDVEFGFKHLQKFMQEAANLSIIGQEFVNGEIAHGQLGLARGDVHDWAKVVGAINYDWKDGQRVWKESADGLVNYGVKEVDIIKAKARRILDDGGAATVGNWIEDHFSKAVANQNSHLSRHGVSGYLDALTTAFQHIDGRTAEGQLLLKTQGNTLGVQDQNGEFTSLDKDGKQILGVFRDGKYEVSVDAFEDLPDLPKGRPQTVQDLNRTMLMMGDMGVDIYEGGQIKTDLQKVLAQTKGVSMFQVGQGFSQEYVPLIDTELVARGDQPVMKKLDKSQTALWRAVKEYNVLEGTYGKEGENLEKYKKQVGKARNKVETAISEHKEQLRYLFASSREGSASKVGMTAKMDMAGQYYIQGINPMQNSNYKEGSVYVSKDNFLGMINNSESNIYEQILKKNSKGVSIKQMRKEIIDHTKKNGLYGFTNRYPSIDEDTIMSLKVEIDDTLKGSDKGAYVAVGTATRLKADYDGDFLSIVMAQYKSKKHAGAMHEAMQTMHESDRRRFELVGASVQRELEKQAEEKGMTVAQLVKDTTIMNSGAVENVIARVRKVDAMESLQARLGKTYIGKIDNARHKLLGMAETTNSVMRQNKQTRQWASQILNVGIDAVDDELSAQRARVAEFGRIVSQDLISSKKFSAEDIADDLIKSRGFKAGTVELENEVAIKMESRIQALRQAEEVIAQSNFDESARRKLVEANKELKLFDMEDKPSVDRMLESGISQEEMLKTGRVQGQQYNFDEMFDAVQRNFLLNSGSSNELQKNTSLSYAVSGGSKVNDLSSLVQGNGKVYGVEAIRALMSQSDEAKKVLQPAIERHERTVKYNMERMASGDDFYKDALDNRGSQLADDMLSGSTMADKQVTRITDVTDKFLGGSSVDVLSSMKWGGAMFGGLWATSALMRKTPTPEGMQEYDEQYTQQMSARSAAAQMSGPTARIQSNHDGENINVRIRAKDAQGMSQDEITAIVQQEMNAMMNMDMNMSVNISDNTQNLDQNWIQTAFANALNKGLAF